MNGYAGHGSPARGQVRGINSTWQGTGTWQRQANASEKINPFPGRLSFSLHFCYFSCDLFGGIEIFRIFANGMNGIDFLK